MTAIVAKLNFIVNQLRKKRSRTLLLSQQGQEHGWGDCKPELHGYTSHNSPEKIQHDGYTRPVNSSNTKASRTGIVFSWLLFIYMMRLSNDIKLVGPFDYEDFDEAPTKLQ